ncbi:MAG: PD-(D/E)XK nuclease domain-containing protein, partial [Succinivibrio sp.]|nr:PD-(D/E)XK nuclease domain-containing protein [Succinivibrio sp.]
FNQAKTLVDLLMENKVEESQSLIGTMLKEFLSVRNSGSEFYYHGFMTGVLGLACAAKGIEFFEEFESGNGISDLILDSFAYKTACILELKKTKNVDDCFDAAQSATEQIIKKDYASRFISRRYKKVYGLGIGFAKKGCEIVPLGNLVEKRD